MIVNQGRSFQVITNNSIRISHHVTRKWLITLCMLGNLQAFLSSLDFSFSNLPFNPLIVSCKIFTGDDLNVNQFGSRSGPKFCWAWSGSKLFAKFISIRSEKESRYIHLLTVTQRVGIWTLNSMIKVFTPQISIDLEFKTIIGSMMMEWKTNPIGPWVTSVDCF